MNRVELARLVQLVGDADVRRIEDNARVAEQIERVWCEKFKRFFDQLLDETLDMLEQDAGYRWPPDLLDRIGALLLEHELQTTEAALRTITPAEWVRAARPKRWPDERSRIRALWDQWRRTGKLPGRTADQARAVKTLYIRRVQQAWQQYGATFISGEPRSNGVRPNGSTEWNRDAFDRSSARKAIEQAFRVPRARANTIVETETTRYYNTARVNTYNQIDSVVGYLYVVVRDHATTKWCWSRRGMVVFKGTELMRHNTPPCHWNCRSELLPLSRLNPAHRRLLEDESLWASNRKLVPLPHGWNEARAA